MAIELQRIASTPMAQTLAIRSHALVVDGTAAEGGDDADPNPHGLYDAALGSCKALTVLWYARRKGIPVTDVRTVIERDASAERAGTTAWRPACRSAVISATPSCRAAGRGAQMSGAQAHDGGHHRNHHQRGAHGVSHAALWPSGHLRTGAVASRCAVGCTPSIPLGGTRIGLKNACSAYEISTYCSLISV